MTFEFAESPHSVAADSLGSITPASLGSVMGGLVTSVGSPLSIALTPRASVALVAPILEPSVMMTSLASRGVSFGLQCILVCWPSLANTSLDDVVATLEPVQSL